MYKGDYPLFTGKNILHRFDWKFLKLKLSWTGICSCSHWQWVFASGLFNLVAEFFIYFVLPHKFCSIVLCESNIFLRSQYATKNKITVIILQEKESVIILFFLAAFTLTFSKNAYYTTKMDQRWISHPCLRSLVFSPSITWEIIKMVVNLSPFFKSLSKWNISWRQWCLKKTFVWWNSEFFSNSKTSKIAKVAKKIGEKERI